MSVRVDLKPGETFGRLTVVGFADVSNKQVYLCSCSCGREHRVPKGDLKSGGVRSCGCLRRDLAAQRATTHGKSRADDRGRTPTYNTWRSMNWRCRTKQGKTARLYSDRGIRVCERWQESFLHFLVDMGERPEGHTLDRIDPNGNYEPDNCRWATPAQQAVNRRSDVALGRISSYDPDELRACGEKQAADMVEIARAALGDRFEEAA